MSFRVKKLKAALLNGEPRAGKGETVGHFGARQGVATDETGADYRAVTWSLEDQNVIEFGMPREVIGQRLARVTLAQLVEYANSRKQIIATHGKEVLYAPEIASTVGDVAPHAAVRKAVKAGFKERIASVRDNDEHDLLVVDGRNLEAVIESVEGVELIMRGFMSVHPVEAAYRECLRLGIDPMSSEGQVILAQTISRREKDANRMNDPVRPDEGALHFSHDPELRDRALGRLAEHMFGNDAEAARKVMVDALEWPPFSRVRSREIGRVAAITGRQIAIDTTAFRGYEEDDDPSRPAREMLKTMDGMLDDALSLSGVKV